MTIPSSRSLIFEVKSIGSERLQKTSDVFGRLRTFSEDFGNDRVLFKNPSTPRIKSQVYISEKVGRNTLVILNELSLATTVAKLILLVPLH